MSRARELAEFATGYDAGGGLNFRNRIINGDMRIDQRNAGAAITVGGGGYAVDRYFIQSNVGSGHTLQQVAEAPTGFAYSNKLTIGTGATPTTNQFGRLIYYVEGQDCVDFDWTTANAKAVTLSFWVRSSVTGTFGVCFKLQAASPYTAFFSSYTINAANTWEYKTVTVPEAVMTAGGRSTTNGIGILVAWDLGEGPDRSTTAGYQASSDGGTLGLTGGTKIVATSGATWQVTGVQLEVGSVATPFERRPYGTELSLCQRYYETSYASGTAVGTATVTNTVFWYAQGSGNYNNQIGFFKVPKRASPTTVIYSALGTSGKITNSDTNTDVNGRIIQSQTNQIVAGADNVSIGQWVALSYHYTASAEL